jgi:hypothetical protein
MKKRSRHERINRENRSSILEKHHMIARRVSVSHIPESIVEAYGRVQSLVERSGPVSLEEVQAAVEYLLDIVKATRGENG